MMSEFHHIVGNALHSPYFTNPPEELTGEPLIQWWDEKDAESDALKKAADEFDSPDALPERERGILERAVAQMPRMFPGGKIPKIKSPK